MSNKKSTYYHHHNPTAKEMESFADITEGQMFYVGVIGPYLKVDPNVMSVCELGSETRYNAIQCMSSAGAVFPPETKVNIVTDVTSVTKFPRG
ncbi:hypothetical protein [Delftia phage PhiW-14]|uniref:Uncharacterized protein n=1 Tax=Delftia phage PhiW-14 TaxID=665032 RepID=C9DGB7_BPW14|nr:hypothetical protein DP-phiW-14_gp147 [Delftia phage PhiW-14]ACV50168.1 hypothetical protein [Delftia phage PhiW-14]